MTLSRLAGGTFVFVCTLAVSGCSAGGGGSRATGQNGTDGDGCSSNCLVEPGASCMGMPSKCTVAVCGNGVQEGNEGCDCGDGTAAHPVPASCPGPNGLFTGDGSGCSKTCTKEPQCR